MSSWDGNSGDLYLSPVPVTVIRRFPWGPPRPRWWGATWFSWFPRNETQLNSRLYSGTLGFRSSTCPDRGDLPDTIRGLQLREVERSADGTEYDESVFSNEIEP